MSLLKFACAASLCCALAALAPVAHAQMGGDMAGSSPARVDPNVPYRAGIAAFNARDYPEAVRQLRNARRASPRYGNITYALGLAYAANGEKGEAKTAFQQSTRSRNAPVQARVQLGLVSIELNDRDTALEQQSELQRMLAGCDVSCGDTRRGQIQGALDQLTRAIGVATPPP